MSPQPSTPSRSRQVLMFVAAGVALMLAVPGAATAKDERNGPVVLPSEGVITASTSCLGTQSDILHPPSGPDAFSFNLPFDLDKDNIRIISPSTFKRFRKDSTPGGGAPFGRFDYQVRRDEHDQTPFVFEVVVPWVHLKLSDFGVNADGHQFVTRINGIFWEDNGQNENRAFSDCLAAPPNDNPPLGNDHPLDQAY